MCFLNIISTYVPYIMLIFIRQNFTYTWYILIHFFSNSPHLTSTHTCFMGRKPKHINSDVHQIASSNFPNFSLISKSQLCQIGRKFHFSMWELSGSMWWVSCNVKSWRLCFGSLALGSPQFTLQILCTCASIVFQNYAIYIPLLSYHWDRIHNTLSLKEGKFILARAFSPWSGGTKLGIVMA